MRRRLLSFILAVSVVLGAVSAIAQTSGLKLPAYKRVRLKNGMTVLLLEQHSVPLIAFDVIVKAGSAADPAGKEGIALMTASLLRKGSKARSAEQFSTALDFIGGEFTTNVNTDYSVVSAEFVKKDLAEGLDLLSEALLRPSFPQDEFSKLLKQRVDGLKAAKDQPQAVIGAYFNAYLFDRHPYGRPVGGDEKSMAALTQEDAARFYEAFYTPGNTILAVAGDFSSAEMEKLITQKFEAWPSRQSPKINLAEPTPSTGRRLLLIDKPDATQTYYRIGNVGVARTNADRVYLRVVNTLFGGRFTSMLNSELRIKSGLTYGANSFFDEKRVRGSFVISSYTKNATTGEALDKTLDVLQRLHAKGITEEELKSAKNYIQGQFPPTIETSGQLAFLIAELEQYGLDEREINNFYAQINAMTMADAQRVIKQYYPLDNLVFVVIGKASEIGDVLKKYAPSLETRSINEPGFGGQKTVAQAGQPAAQ
ncbi:MAG TPA: pitrilysin family protein [Candidatus Angelobacter sp.]|nr:pitrilysin family protein [Candidatus Angelobacter sp.]